MKSRLLSFSVLIAAVIVLPLVANAPLRVAAARAAGVLSGQTSLVGIVAPSLYRWTLDQSPNYGTEANLLEGVSAASPNDVWAVGLSNATSSGGRNLTEHFNGNAWHIVDSPNMGTGSNLLVGVAALSHNNAWAVGAYYSGSNQFTLTEHWNGSAWSIVPSPNPSPNMGGNAFGGISAVSSHDVWAVGAYNTGPGALDASMVMHWDGTSWQIVPSPNNPGFNALGSVSARSSTDAWAVGMSASDWTLADARPLVMHWDGTAWSLIAVPVPEDATVAYLSSVSMGSHNNVWAVGTYETADGIYHTLSLHWDGQQWIVMPGYSIMGAVYTELRGVAVSNTGDVWAVGWGAPTLPPNPFSGPPEAYPGARTVILRWSNGAWHRADSPSPGVGSQLMGLAVFANQAWAIGNGLHDSSSPNQTLIEHYGPRFSTTTSDLNPTQ